MIIFEFFICYHHFSRFLFDIHDYPRDFVDELHNKII